jgi:O-antigen ligase
MYSERPFFGFGVNNFKIHLLDYDPEMRWAVENEDLATRQLNLRIYYAPPNGFFFLLAEAGLVGLGAFLAFLAGAVVMGIRAVRTTGGPWAAACLGLLVGMLGTLAQQLIDFSIWTDPLLFSFALVVVMLNLAPWITPGATAVSMLGPAAGDDALTRRTLTRA